MIVYYSLNLDDTEPPTAVWHQKQTWFIMVCEVEKQLILEGACTDLEKPSPPYCQVASRRVVNRKKQRLDKVGTFNEGTIRTDFRAFELQKLTADLKIDVLVIQEHRRSDVVRRRFSAQSSNGMADSPWSSLRTKCWWYRLSSVVAVFALASRLQVRH